MAVTPGAALYTAYADQWVPAVAPNKRVVQTHPLVVMLALVMNETYTVLSKQQVVVSDACT